MSIIRIEKLQYAYQTGKPVLKGITTELEAGKMYAILGPSGCGKTTLLSLLGGHAVEMKNATFKSGVDVKDDDLCKIVLIKTEDSL